jgi:O-acetyl-ADP-ribose deacetylase (regulator of RNase III)
MSQSRRDGIRSTTVQRIRISVISAPGKALEICGPADITTEQTEAIVNAANSYLIGGGGVDGAIHDAGGPSILAECKAYVSAHGNLPPGKAMLTSGGNLAAKYVIHTVGPVYRGGERGEKELLASCYRESIRLADVHGISSLAFPAISTGAYGYPLHEAAAVAVTAALDTLDTAKSVKRVRFVLFDHAATKAFTRAAEKLLHERGRSDYAVDRVVTPTSNT